MSQIIKIYTNPKNPKLSDVVVTKTTVMKAMLDVEIKAMLQNCPDAEVLYMDDEWPLDCLTASVLVKHELRE